MSSNTSISDAYSPLPKPDTNNATYIGWTEIDESEYWLADTVPRSKRKYWEFQNQVNSGLRNGKRWNDPYETYRTNRDLILNLTSHLYMRPHQRTRAIDLISRLDLQKLGLRAELVAFCICAYVIHDSENDLRCGYPAMGSMGNICEELREMQKSLGIKDKEFRKHTEKFSTETEVPNQHPSYTTNTRSTRTLNSAGVIQKVIPRKIRGSDRGGYLNR